MKDKKEKAITLIALVVTIIVLIILAGVSISLVLGDNGIITKAKEAKLTYEEEAAREKVNMLLLEYRTNKEDSDETLEEFLNRKKDEGQLDEVINNGDGTHTVITDGYEFIIDDETLEIIEVVKESWFSRLTRGKAKFVYTIESEYVADVDVGIEIDESVKMYTIQYKIGDGEEAEWKDYTEGETFKVTMNGTIYGRIVNQETNEVGYKFKSTITAIDTMPPQKATIVFNKKSVDVGGTIQATVTHEDLETGIVPAKCKFIIDTNASNYGTTSNTWESATAFTSNPQIINITKTAVNYYYVHVLSCDEAGNLTETISEPIYFSGWVTLYSVHASDAFKTNKSTFTNSWTGTGSRS